MKTVSNKAIKIAVVAAAAVLFANNTQAAGVSATANASVIAPIAISQTAAMEFGSMSPTAVAGTVVLTTAGVRTSTNVDLAAGATPAAGAFSVSGNANSAYSVTLPTTVTLASGANSMTLQAFGDDAGATPTIPGTGPATFSVGATLVVGANQAAGGYTGSYTVTVNYN